MQVDFSNDGSPATPVEVIQPLPISPAPAAPAQAAAVAPSAALTTTREVEVPVTRKMTLSDRLPSFADVILPRLNIVHNTGNLKDTFTPGSIVFNQNTVLYTAGKTDTKTGNSIVVASSPLKLWVVGIISDRFAEKVQGGFGGQIVNTEADVRNAGGTLDYAEWKLKRSSGMKRFEPLTDLLIVMERPALVADDGKVFNFTVEGKKLALAAWAVKGGAYTRVMKRVLNYNRLAGILQGGFPTWSFFLGTCAENFKTEGGESASAWMPVIVPAEKTPEPMLAFIYNIAGTPTV